MNKDLILALHNNGSMWFILGSCISADANMTNEERLENIDTMQQMLKLFKEPEVTDAIETKTLKKYASYCRKGIKMLKREIEEETNKQ